MVPWRTSPLSLVMVLSIDEGSDQKVAMNARTRRSPEAPRIRSSRPATPSTRCSRGQGRGSGPHQGSRSTLSSTGVPISSTPWDEFFLFEDVPEHPPDTPEFDTIFVPWFVLHYVPDPHEDDVPPDWPGETVARHYLRHTTLVDPAHRRFVEQSGGSPFSFFVVTGRVPVVTGRVPGRHLALVQAAGPPLPDGSVPQPGRVLRRPADQRRACAGRR